MSTHLSSYKALALQLTTASVNSCTSGLESKNQMLAAVSRIHAQTKASKAFIGSDLQLVVLPEYFLTGFPMGETTAEWQEKGCIHPNDEVYGALKHLAEDCKIHLSGNVYELDDHFQQLFFQTSFIIGPTGTLLLRYRRLNSMYAATPHDVFDEYISVYGMDSLFPVAHTPLGNLACLASEEILYPEIARCLSLKGAEIFLHNTSEVGALSPTPKNIAKQARAIENMAYVISANSAGITGYAIPAHSTDGHSQIVQYEGMVLCEAGFGESMVANATINLGALREHRMRPGMSNYLSRQRFELFAPTYTQSIYPANSLQGKNPSRSHYIQQQQSVIAMLKEKKIIL
ncbi:MAG: nitrilase [Bacteroidetes bacterium]|nr:nitrilase [Bacteroidota bacterium]